MLLEMFYRKRICPVVSLIFRRTCGSISNVLNYKNVIWTTPTWFIVTYDCCFSLRAPFGPLFDYFLSWTLCCYSKSVWWRCWWSAWLFQGYFHWSFSQEWPGRPPLFSIELWNKFNRTAEELPGTYGNIETWHNSFQANVSSTHPMFWKFLDVLRLVWVRMLQKQAGHAPEPQRRSYSDCNTRILRIVDDYQNRQVMDYLRNITHDFSL